MSGNNSLSSHQSSSFPLARFSKILVAIDGSDSSLYAAKYSIVLAKKDNAQLIALNVAILPALKYVGPSLLEEWRSHTMMEAEVIFDKVRTFAIENSKSDGKQIKLKTELLESSMPIDAAIVDYADKQDVDMIVVGTKGKSEFKKLVLGSVASGVVTYARRPVMVVK